MVGLFRTPISTTLPPTRGATPRACRRYATFTQLRCYLAARYLLLGEPTRTQRSAFQYRPI